jgi:hypothetical protein
MDVKNLGRRCLFSESKWVVSAVQKGETVVTGSYSGWVRSRQEWAESGLCEEGVFREKLASQLS